jgi:two-component system response regulator BaeR
VSGSAHVLIVEDEPKLAALLRDYLQATGYAVSVLADGADAVEFVRHKSPDVVLLDLLLPHKNGLSICREVRSFSNVPIIMVTARVEEVDRLLGLELGADDYVCKPFSPREVVARVKALLRRAAPGSTPSSSPLDLDSARHSARWNDQALTLTPVEFRLLSKLSSQSGRVFSRAQLMDALYLDHRVVSDRTVDSHIKNLRAKLTATGGDPIASVYGVGYRFDWPERGETQ